MTTPANDLNITQPGYVVFDGTSTFTGRTFQAGTGITLTNASGIAGNTTISLSGGGSAVEHLTGNTGGQLNPDGSNNFNILTANTTLKFSGSAATLTQDFSLTNLVLGSSLPSVTSGASNIGMGQSVLAGITSGNFNIGIGNLSLQAITTGSSNIAIGFGAGRFLTGGANTYVGTSAGDASTSTSNNTGIGDGALSSYTTGAGNTGSNVAIGFASLTNLLTGVNNISLGTSSGNAYSTSESSNISIGNTGTAAESNKIRIGTSGSGTGQQNATFIAGINGVNVGSVASVVSISGDQLGLTTITAGTGITVTPGANTITLSVTGSGFTWTDVTGATQTISVENGYLTDRAGGVTYTLPASGTLGDEIRIVGKLGITTIAQNANQQILMSSASSTVGITGSVVGTNVGDCIDLICITAGASTVWRAANFLGNWTVS